jgi:acyl-CoA thioester hydrolase
MKECPAMTDRSHAALAAIEAAADERPKPLPRSAYRRFVPLTTRWLDNDAYGHINNVVYYALFDTAVNAVLIEAGALDIAAGPVIGYVVETHCNYFAPLSFPQPLEAGIRVGRIGGSSVRYEIGIFAAGDPLCAARGHFIHVYVDRETRRPVPLPDPLLAALKPLEV